MVRNKVLPLLFFSLLVLFLILFMQPLEVALFRDYLPVLFPAGTIGEEQIRLLLIIQALMLLVMIPVFILTFYFSWKFRAGQRREIYDPHLVDHKGLEVIWWGVPLVLVAIIGVLTWVKTYELDPYKPIASEKKALVVEVVATQWNWLFIYPEEKIASLNFLAIPEKTPIHFKITADAPMNSFWIPELGGQIYAMPGMQTELFLIANSTGDFMGRSANISGKGFAGMQFITRAETEENFKKWIAAAQKEGKGLDWNSYSELAKPAENTPPAQFTLSDPALFHQVLMKFMKGPSP